MHLESLVPQAGPAQAQAQAQACFRRWPREPNGRQSRAVWGFSEDQANLGPVLGACAAQQHLDLFLQVGLVWELISLSSSP